MKHLWVLLLLILVSLPAWAKSDAQKLSITSQGKARTYYLFVPDGGSGSKPLILLLHGSGRNGMSLIDPWKGLAEKEGIILVAPDSLNSQEWAFPVDGPNFLHEVVEAVRAKYPVDAKRIYLFGHSAGAVFSLYMGIAESKYFAAVAVHAGALRDNADQYMEHAERKTPIAIWVGNKDPFFSLQDVHATRDSLAAHGFQPKVTEMPGHDHNYYGVAGDINKTIWDFLRAQQLEDDPEWEDYKTR
ncbi:MAG TPA: alpha/beta hydrolase-fold protein [Candidatus Angelobacter sp.]|jgi:poly(3-hydroxybutyrate) depolymerase|nr:alpha/beta hydrolase-fold protein [Candidatus Angelobacter sp.]